MKTLLLVPLLVLLLAGIGCQSSSEQPAKSADRVEGDAAETGDEDEGEEIVDEGEEEPTPAAAERGGTDAPAKTE